MPIPIPKPPKRKTEQRKRRRTDGRWVRQVREAVVQRDGNLCRICAGNQIDDWQPRVSRWLHMHEIVYRSKTMGRPMKERVNTHNCIMVCDECHREIHDKKLWVKIVNKTKGADGPLLFSRTRPDE
jgi:hypothetical protein